jgi:hypothetical protein
MDMRQMHEIHGQLDVFHVRVSQMGFTNFGEKNNLKLTGAMFPDGF